MLGASVARLIQRPTVERVPNKPREPRGAEWILFQWRRMTLKGIKLLALCQETETMIKAVRMETVATMLDALMPNTTNIRKKATSIPSAPPPMRVIKDEMATTMLPASAGKYGSGDPSTCSHPDHKMRARANRTIKWFTCVECGS
eukprot:6459229-Amphidinium_carterae.1